MPQDKCVHLLRIHEEIDDLSSFAILVVDDETAVRSGYIEALRSSGYLAFEAGTGTEALRIFSEQGPNLVLLDVHLPDRDGLEILREMKALASEIPIIMITGYAAVDTAVEALKEGAHDYLEKPIKLDHLLHCIGHALEIKTLRSEAERRIREERSAFAVESIIGESQSIREIRELVKRVAASRAETILVVGESGTGKELVARALHFESDRRRSPFRVLNCAAIPEQLLESELFGHEKGAFTGASVLKKGLFELADGGTLVLDEIGELDLGLQAKLLRVLEDRSFRRVGGEQDVRVDVRVVCATNCDLDAMAREGQFRSDLFYRLAVIPVTLPPLRERIEDLPLLVAHIIVEFNRRFGKKIEGATAQALEKMRRYPWPGNVRELRNALERVLILRDDGWIEASDLALRATGFASSSANGLPMTADDFPEEGVDLYGIERQLIQQALEKSGGNKSRAARLLSISRDTLRYKLKKYDLG